MPELHLTPAQDCAIHTRGSTVLVSAAAGSGKTFVLTERLMAYLTDEQNPVDLDRFLIITYTRAAAAELRARILAELSSRIAADPECRRLRRQSALAARAQIGTIHSFCAALLRENCAAVGLAPDFRVADASRADALRASALEKLLEDAYRTIDTDADFRLLVDTVGAGRDDARLSALILQLYDKMQCHARPALWAEAQHRALALGGVTDAGATPWGQELLQRAAESAAYWAEELDSLLRDMATPGSEWLMNAYGPSIGTSADGIRALQRAAAQGWDAVREALAAVEFPRLTPLRSPPDPERKERVQARREACRKAVGDLQLRYAESSEKVLSDLCAAAPAMQALLRLTLDFGKRFSAEKRRRSLVDFSDLEHMAAALLTKEDGSPTSLAEAVSSRYTEIMVDEYQDVSEVQDLIFRAVSRKEQNLFFVGDVKQSIYRFRLADPGIFLEKYRRYADAETAEPGAPRRILLRENFRSREAILAAANHVFKNIMSTSLGELDYDGNAALRCGADFPDAGERPELCLLTLPEEVTLAADERSAWEAAYVAGRIRAMVDSGVTVRDRGAERPVGWGDIVILLRNANAVGPVYRQALAARGIPVLSDLSGGFFASTEVSVLLSLLAVIDNPHQDIPLIAVLRSPLFGFSPDDLAAVRAADRTHDFFDAVTAAAEAREDCRSFLETLGTYRRLAAELELSALLQFLCGDRALPALCSALPDGDTRLRNLTLLLEQAQVFAETGAHGLHAFVVWLRRQAEEGREPAAAVPEHRAVRIMSVHKSKGLEFPVVFLCDLSHMFNKSDTKSTVLVHPQLGLGPKRTDPERGIEYPTFARNAVAERLLRETLSEEMRLLYVAMTRAKERLILTGTFTNLERTLGQLHTELSSPLAPEVLRRAASPMHWVLQAALLDRDETFFRRRTVVMEAEEGDSPSVPEAEEAAPADPALLAALERNLGFRYPHAAAETLPSKVTATELKRLESPVNDPEAAALLPKPAHPFRKPDFALRERPLTGAEKGTATHRVLQYLHFADAQTPEGVARQLAALTAAGTLTEREAGAVRADAVTALVQSPLGQRILRAEAAGLLRREFRFSLLWPSGRLFPGVPDEEILLQGAVDCCFEEDGALIVVDYKTDRIPPEAVPERTAYYAGQLRAYAEAMARITGKTVRERLLYFLHNGCISAVDA